MYSRKCYVNNQIHITFRDLSMKSRAEINLSRLLSKCQEMANNSENLADEWRLPKFISSCEELFNSLPKHPDTTAPSNDCLMEYQNKIKFLKSILPPIDTNENVTMDTASQTPNIIVPLPQGFGLARDTISKQIYQDIHTQYPKSQTWFPIQI